MSNLENSQVPGNQDNDNHKDRILNIVLASFGMPVRSPAYQFIAIAPGPDQVAALDESLRSGPDEVKEITCDQRQCRAGRRHQYSAVVAFEHYRRNFHRGNRQLSDWSSGGRVSARVWRMQPERALSNFKVS
jgi:hypothetical protein